VAEAQNTSVFFCSDGDERIILRHLNDAEMLKNLLSQNDQNNIHKLVSNSQKTCCCGSTSVILSLVFWSTGLAAVLGASHDTHQYTKACGTRGYHRA